MDQKLKLLIVEDSADDTLILIRHIRKSGFEPEYKRVETRAGLKEALKSSRWDLIIADYVLPSFSGIDALRISREEAPTTPFILVSGNVSEDIAVEAMGLGAHDCIMKDNLTRLIPVIKREIDRVSHIRLCETDKKILGTIIRSREKYVKVIVSKLSEELTDVDEREIHPRVTKYADFIQYMSTSSNTELYME